MAHVKFLLFVGAVNILVIRLISNSTLFIQSIILSFLITLNCLFLKKFYNVPKIMTGLIVGLGISIPLWISIFLLTNMFLNNY